MTINVQYGAGRFHLSSGGEGELYRMEIRYNEDRFIPVREYDAEAHALRLGVRSREGGGMHVSMGDRRRGDASPAWMNLALSPDVPLALDLRLGAVQSEIDLGGLSLSRVRIETGASDTRLRFSRPNRIDCDLLSMEAGAASFRVDQIVNANCSRMSFEGGVGEVTLDFGGAWRRSMTADVTVGLGSLNLRLPRDVGVEVHLSRLLASFDAAGFEKRGGTYYSANYATARYRLTLNVNASLGGVDVAWVN